MSSTIDPIKTGEKIKTMLNDAGYSVKYIQDYLDLACPQSIYRWYKGQILPSVEHLCALSRLLGVHMDELLVLQSQKPLWVWELTADGLIKRIAAVHKSFEHVLMAA
ncbi:MAG: helix-turn-helix transcriptional regulator [Lachnospira sp.]|nr:helix-turn-helix transcriptional regulator [Lachnospira sp.]